MDFKEGYKLEIGKDVKKKGKFSYLSWSRAVEHLRVHFPDATWIVHEHNDFPFFQTPLGVMVKASVVVDNRQYTQWHPVLDHTNKPVEKPTTFQINASIQRCIVKAIGLATGIGLALYSGDDLPTPNEEVEVISEEQAIQIKDFLEHDNCDEEALLKWAGVDKVEAIPASKYNLAIAGLTKRVAE